MRVGTMLKCLAMAGLTLLACPARGQDVLYARTGDFAFAPIASALRELGLDDHTLVFGSESLLRELESRSWDLVIVRAEVNFLPAFEAAILAELEDHVAGGGALHFQMAELDEASPAYFDLLGLEGAVELELPLRPLDTIEPPRHPSMPFGGLPLNERTYPPDFGDTLLPSPGSRTIIEYEGAGDCTVVSRGGRVLVNGHQWDNWSPGQVVAREQIRWLLRCRPDLDLDGTLTLGDFLVFQNLFAVGDPSADFDGDGELTIFDFLAFQNAFAGGCP